VTYYILECITIYQVVSSCRPTLPFSTRVVKHETEQSVCKSQGGQAEQL